jgi:pilus assembly protein CpaD
MSSTKRLALIGGLTALILTAGCATAPVTPTIGRRVDAPTPLDQYAAGIRETPEQVGLAVHPEGVTATQRQALVEFAERWRAAGSGMITVQTPNDAADAAGARAYAEAAISTLGVLGVPYDHVQVIGYAAGPQPKMVVLASFLRSGVEIPDCRSVPWENLTATRDNKPYNRFGCTLTANMAAQLADPSDLAGNTPLAPADNSRRMVVLGKYRDGKVTASDKDTQASGVVSSAVNP